uniref:Large ribosomal subunit protein eL34 n=1 Tax=Echinococcus canadensis TaxID=519352 RepID=A0A915EXC5_9CEST
MNDQEPSPSLQNHSVECRLFSSGFVLRLEKQCHQLVSGVVTRTRRAYRVVVISSTLMSKKKAEVPKTVLFGRIGTNLKCGIVGLPNVGKSTFFNVLTTSAAAAANFPFCTIEPNESRVAVPDERFDYLCEHYQPVSRVPAYLNVVDIAGLVKGAHEGAGLGNAFLSHIKAVDGIFQVLRIFDDPDVSHVEGDVDPIRDLEIIREELRLKDEEYVNTTFDKLEKSVIRGGDKKQKPDYDCIAKAKHLLCEERKGIRFGEWNAAETEILNDHLFITSKPVIYLINMSQKDFFRKKNKLVKIKEYVDANDPGAVMIPFSADFELRYAEMSEAEKKAFSEENPSKNTKAPQAAGKIHTDMERGFIMAEVMAFDEFKAEGSEAACKAAGKYRQKGRDYIVQDGDIIYFKFNAGAVSSRRLTLGLSMQRLTLRRRLSYNTNSNRRKKVKTPGGKLVYIYQKKLGTFPKCGDCKCKLAGIKPSRPMTRSRMSKRLKTVTRSYGGSRCHACVRSRILRAFLMEEQKVLKQILKEKRKDRIKQAIEKRKAAAQSGKKAAAKAEKQAAAPPSGKSK